VVAIAVNHYKLNTGGSISTTTITNIYLTGFFTRQNKRIGVPKAQLLPELLDVASVVIVKAFGVIHKQAGWLHNLP